MTSGQFFEGAKCTVCDTPLPKMIDERGWGLAKCSKCGKRYDTCEYKRAGGRFHTGTGCKCERCTEMEN